MQFLGASPSSAVEQVNNTEAALTQQQPLAERSHPDKFSDKRNYRELKKNKTRNPHGFEVFYFQPVLQLCSRAEGKEILKTTKITHSAFLGFPGTMSLLNTAHSYKRLPHGNPKSFQS
jgi:hypothetical protein